VVSAPAVPALTVSQAVAALGRVIDDGLQAEEIRRDAGLDLQTVVNNLHSAIAAGSADMPEQVSTLRNKVAARANEGAISPRYADRLDAAISQLAAAR
jgi:serine/threonine-protein kinase